METLAEVKMKSKVGNRPVASCVAFAGQQQAMVAGSSSAVVQGHNIVICRDRSCTQ